MTLPTPLQRDPHPCIILDLRCLNCGPVRVVIKQPPQPPRSRPCPYCGAKTPATVLGYGGTVRALPFWSTGADAEELDHVVVFSDRMPVVLIDRLRNGRRGRGLKQ